MLVVSNFLGNHKAVKYVELVDNMLKAYDKWVFYLQIDFFPLNLGAVSDEHGERFHLEISEMERRYQGRCNPNMMGGFCWFLQRETNTSHKRNSKYHAYFEILSKVI